MESKPETMGEQESVTVQGKFGGFALKSKAEVKLQPASTVLGVKAHFTDDRQSEQKITSLSKDVQPEKKQALVIPMVQNAADVTMAAAAASLLLDAQRDGTDQPETGDKMVLPLLQKNNLVTKGPAGEGSEKQNYLDDVANRPDVASQEDYASIPVSEFGAALLRGMGWQEGKAVGKTSTSGLVEPIMYVPKFGRGGLGASITIDLPTDPKGRKRILKPGQKRDEKKQLVAAAEADGRVRHYTKVGEALVEKKQLVYEVGAYVKIERGTHAGLYGRVTEVGGINSETLGVRLGVNGHVIRLPRRRTALVSGVEYKAHRHDVGEGADHAQARDNRDEKDRYTHRESDTERGRGDRERSAHRTEARQWPRDSKEESESGDDRDSRDHAGQGRRETCGDAHKGRGGSRNGDRDRDKDRGRDRKRYRGRDSDDGGERKRGREDDRNREKADKGVSKGPTRESRSERTWLRPGITVRVVSRTYERGKHYTAKVTVADVVGLHECECRSDNGRLLSGLTDSMLETVIPKGEMTVVMVVKGSFAGEVGRIVERDSRRCTATVQLLRERTAHTFKYEDICQYNVSDVHDIE